MTTRLKHPAREACQTEKSSKRTFIVDPYTVKEESKRVQTEKQKEKFLKKWSTPETPKIEAIRAEKARLIEE
jgi:hypothetical protein